MSKHTAIQLPDRTYQRLQELAERTGRSAASHIRQAIEDHLDDLEAAASAQEILERIERGDEAVSTLDEVERRLGLAR